MEESSALGVTTVAVPLSIYDFQVQDVLLPRASLLYAALSIAFAPLMWNAVARLQYRTNCISRFTGPKLGCYLLATFIFLLQLEREWIFTVAIYDQPYFVEASHWINQAFAFTLFGFGSLLVLSSFLRLGITGTYLGDYFGILMDDMVTGFPFNAFSHPMYLGSVLNLASTAIFKGSVAGMLLAFWSHAVYQLVSLYLEGPFTQMIYRKRDEQRAKEAKKKKKNPAAQGKDYFDDRKRK